MARRNGSLGCAILCTLIVTATAHAAPGYGKLSGVVVDPSGTPQMGATVWVLAEDAASPITNQLLTNQRGVFSTERLESGFYSVRVTLAGFLPSIERHVRVNPNLTTLLKIELDSVFTSFDRLRRRPEHKTDADEWKWVLRTSAATRSVLQWLDGEADPEQQPQASEGARKHRPRGRVELTSGARRPGSVANLADSPATAFSYDQRIGQAGSLVLAGQMSYERSAAGSLAALWLPSREGRGPEISVLMRQAKLGPAGPTFRALRVQHADQLALGDRFKLHYGAEYVLVGLGPATSSLRPRSELDIRISPDWRVSAIISACPSSPTYDDLILPSALQTALVELDALPTVLWRNGHPLLEDSWHEELALERRVGPHGAVQGAAFHDSARHLAVFGRGTTSNPDFFQDFFSEAFLYDGGASNSWGTRVAYRQKFSDDLEMAAVYAWAGALALEEVAASVDLRDALQTRYRHSLAAHISGRMPKVGTWVAASYKWVSGPVVSRLDSFGEAAYQLDPHLSLSVRQPLPKALMRGKWEALADFHNLLAQGYVPANGRDGRVLLVPAFRSFRGGVSFQF